MSKYTKEIAEIRKNNKFKEEIKVIVKVLEELIVDVRKQERNIVLKEVEIHAFPILAKSKMSEFREMIKSIKRS